MAGVVGYVASGFEPVEALFRKITQTDGPAQLCVYIGDEVVVDLCRLDAKNENYNADSLQIVMSSSKVIAAIAVALTVEETDLSYNDKVAEIWPGFKEKDLTVADVLRHEAGLVRINAEFDLSDFYPENLVNDSVGKLLGEQQSNPGHLEQDGSRQRHYHVFTYGQYAGEICRRKDHHGRTLGRILRDKFGELDIDCYIGVEEDHLMERFVHINIPGLVSLLWTAITKPCRLLNTLRHVIDGYAKNIIEPRMADGTLTMRDRFPFYHRYMLFPCYWTDPETNTKQFFGPVNAQRFFNSKEYVKSEQPGANAISSARGLAKVAGFMANKGRMGGRTLMSEETWHDMHADERVKVVMDMGGIRTQFSQGGINNFVSYYDDQKVEKWFKHWRNGFRGWMGIGGSVCQYHSELKIGFGYVPKNAKIYDFCNSSGARLQREVVKCVQNRGDINLV